MAEFDIIVYGATGFTGGQAARYMAANAPKDLHWAVAGRNRERLGAIGAETGADGIVVADITDVAAVDEMVSKTKVLLTTAGPYAPHGANLVEACVERGVDYVDITGETPWVHGLIERFHEAAAERGVRVVPFCGFDSVPSDIGTLLVVDALRERGAETRTVSASFRMKGGLNGGTLASALGMAERGETAAMADWYLLNPEGTRPSAGKRDADRHSASWDEDRKVWLAPFVMAGVNTRVVRRSAGLAALYGNPYGAEFSYSESLETSKRWKAQATAAVSAAMVGGMRLALVRRFLAKLGPKPGQGPSDEVIEGGFFRVQIVAEGTGGVKARARFEFQGDPGNRFTVTALCESALALVLDRDRLPGGLERGGVLTPATGLGAVLLERLRDAGVETSVELDPSR